jgi:hypothetical protein
MSYKRDVLVPFEGEDGYVMDGVARFYGDIDDTDRVFYVDEDTLTVRVGDQTVALDGYQRADILRQLHEMRGELYDQWVKGYNDGLASMRYSDSLDR